MLNSLTKFKHKIKLQFRRLRLGKRFKHQYSCHPAFHIQRGDLTHDIFWHNKKVAQVGTLKSIKKVFQGNCFTVAAGPSLNEIDFQQLKPFDCISLNCSIKKFSDQGFQPKHCIIVDHRVFENDWECVEASILSGANCYFSAVGLSRICERDPSLLNRDNIFLIEGIGRQFGLPRPSVKEFYKKYQHDPDIYMADDIPTRGAIGFSLNAEKGFFFGKTVATWAVQLAPYLGYKNNYILGMDLGGTGKSYFDSSDRTSIPYDFISLYEPYIKVCFEQAQRAAKENDFCLYNLSQYSTLPNDIVTKISFDDAIKQEINSL
jgi:KDO transferase-3